MEEEKKKEEIPLSLLEILELNLSQIILSLDDFLSWYSACRFLRRHLDDGLIGRNLNNFCKQALERNQSLLERGKHSIHFYNMKKLRYVVKLSEMVDSIMGPIIFDNDAFEKDYIQSCTLESIGFPQQRESEKSTLFELLKKVRVYIRYKYQWQLVILRGNVTYTLGNINSPLSLSHTDSCALKFIPPILSSPKITPSVFKEFSLLTSTQTPQTILQTPQSPTPDCIIS